jgi:hypothetical protein
MQLLVVHHDPEMGDALVQLVKNYTRHYCDLVSNDAEAMDWAKRHQRCDLLLTQLGAGGINGLTLGSALSEVFSGLQVLFFPNYPAEEQRLEITDPKVFPEPISGDDLLGAIERAERTDDGPDLFQVVDILQMCCLSRRNGGLQMVKDGKNGLIFLNNGRVVHAETTARGGQGALFEIVGWKYVEFAYEGSVRVPLETIEKPWDEILIDALNCWKEEHKSQPQSA